MKANPIVGQGTAPEAWQACPLLARLPFCEVDRLVPAGSRAVIVAPHPDDEVLGCGGLLQHLLALGRPVQLISVTDGTASHPGSRQWPAERLAAERPRESAEALRLSPVPVLPDGAFYVYFDVSGTGLTAWQFCERVLDEVQVALTPGKDFGHCGADRYVRLSYAASSEQLAEAIRRLGVFMAAIWGAQA